MREYAVTTDVPAGISSGIVFEDKGEAVAWYWEASQGSYPVGTKVTLWEANEIAAQSVKEA